MISTTAPVETAILVAVVSKSQPEAKAYEYLQELDFLARTLDINVKKHFTQKLDRADTSTFIGSGKLLEIKEYILANPVDWVIFDDELSASQVKNINKELKVNILDRSLLILEIFEKRAHTAQARTQVEMARLQYMLPRLTRMWTHLERQRGGTGTRGGAGEKEIETDRRVIKHKISVLRDKLDKIDKNAVIQRKSRADIVRVAIVGYTNVGKSTLMNVLTKSDILAENKLFATVDATVRKLVWDTVPFLISDTVGFIRKLPHSLIESFKSTLDEVSEADILLHVVDVSHKGFEEHIDVVNNTLAEIHAADKPVIMVFNKVDAVEISSMDTDFEGEKNVNHLEILRKTYFSKNISSVFISATGKTNLNELKSVLLEKVKNRHFEIYPNYVV
ncbi:MAG: GTPase HflX [Cytophagales bacterium]|nr:GTPase HflX [Cytophagales bacterium]